VAGTQVLVGTVRVPVVRATAGAAEIIRAGTIPVGWEARLLRLAAAMAELVFRVGQGTRLAAQLGPAAWAPPQAAARAEPWRAEEAAVPARAVAVEWLGPQAVA